MTPPNEVPREGDYESPEEFFRAVDIGRSWLKDSSLEKWFPFTARELTTLRERVKSLEDEVKRGMEWSDKVEKLRFETANNLTKSIENDNEQEVTIALLRLTVNQLKSRIRELEEKLNRDSQFFSAEKGYLKVRIIELEEAMPKPEELRQMADEFDDGYFTFSAPFRRMADRIEKVMTKQPSEK